MPPSLCIKHPVVGTTVGTEKDIGRGIHEGSHHMGNTDKVKNTAQTAKGNVKEAAGRATGNRDLEAEGIVDKAAGNLKQAGEKVKDAFK
jgi:uncharacterized protein YjbJ (UPF0337 family)